MNDIVERFLRYTRIETTSSEDNENCPSTEGQFVLAEMLKNELLEMGIENAEVADNCFVYAHLAGNITENGDAVGFLAHMDTSNAASGKNVKGRIIENYDGKDIYLGNDVYTRVSDFPTLENYIGKDLIVSDGTTLLGGDDKAGIAIIMTLIERILAENIPHGELYICFTPDEETGSGIEHIDLNKFPVDYAYTLDGGIPEEVTYECFNAASAIVDFNGVSIHPGSAKGKMINAVQLAMDFHALLPVNERPEYTEGTEGFNHIVHTQGTVEYCKSIYIIRNHNAELFERQKQEFINAEQFMNKKYERKVVSVKINDTYRNMIEGFKGREYIIDNAMKAIRENGLQPVNTPIRGGTDGAKLTFMGIPTPNLGTGDMFCHGNHEIVCINEMKTMVDILVSLLRIMFPDTII